MGDAGIRAKRRKRLEQRETGDLVVVERERPVAAALLEEPWEWTVDRLRERVDDDPVGDGREIAADGRIGPVVERDQDLVGDGAQGAEKRGDSRPRAGGHHEDRKRCAGSGRAAARSGGMRA